MELVQKMTYRIIAIMGKSASGKDTVLKDLMAKFPEKLHQIIRTTTRPRREGESLEAYHFIDEHDWGKKAWLLSSDFRGWHYGSSLDDFSEDKVNIGIFSPNEVRILKELNKVFVVRTLYLCADGVVRINRSLHREKHPDIAEICRRYLADEKDFDCKEIDNCDYKVINETALDFTKIEGVILNMITELLSSNP